jgi:hypothetical protein
MSQGVIPFPDQPMALDVAVFCAAQAEAIRVLGRRVVRDVIEIGQRLIDVRKTLGPRGGFVVWVQKEFGWGEAQAFKFMRIAESWGELISPLSVEMAIDVGALALLSHEHVPDETREKAVERAIEGEHITLAEAKEMIAGEVADKIAEMRREAQRQRDAAVAAATTALRDELDELRAAEREPTVEDAIEIMKRISGRKQLTRTQTHAVAMLTGYAVPYKGEMIPPAAPADVRIAEFKLEQTSAFVRAIEFFGQAALSVDEMFAASMPFQRNVARIAIPVVLDWLMAYQKLLQAEDEGDGKVKRTRAQNPRPVA